MVRLQPQFKTIIMQRGLHDCIASMLPAALVSNLSIYGYFNDPISWLNSDKASYLKSVFVLKCM